MGHIGGVLPSQCEETKPLLAGTDTPFTRYNRLSTRLNNRFDKPVEQPAGESTDEEDVAGAEKGKSEIERLDKVNGENSELIT